MSTLWITQGLPDDKDRWGLLITLNPVKGTPAETVLSHVCSYSYDEEAYSYISGTDAYIECHLDGSTLTADVVTYPAHIQRAGVDLALFAEPAEHDPLGRRILRVTGKVDPARYAQAVDDGIAVVFAQDVATREQLEQRMADRNDWWPLIFCPSPAPDEYQTPDPP